MKEPDFFEELAILVGRSDEPQGFLGSERKADFVCDVMIRFGYIRDQSVCRLYP
jgi:hypothetical protein